VVRRCKRGGGDGGVVRWTMWGRKSVWAQINQTEPLWLGLGLGVGVAPLGTVEGDTNEVVVMAGLCV
jgi:hypothetical protein